MSLKCFSLNGTHELWFRGDKKSRAAVVEWSPPYFTKHVIIFEIAKGRFVLINTLSGAIDFFDGNSPLEIADILSGKTRHPKAKILRNYFFERGYLFSSAVQELKAIEKVISNYSHNIRGSHYLINMTTECNFACPYCYERDILKSRGTLTADQISSCLKTIRRHEHKKRDVSIGIFGGEPLMPELAEGIEVILEAAKKAGWKVGITTNGYTLVDYLPLLRKYKKVIDGICVTVDGTEKIHNLRRMLGRSANRNTFRRIVKGIDSITKLHVPVIIKVNIDRNNIANLPKLRQYALKRGWIQNKLIRFLFGEVMDFARSKSYFLSSKQQHELNRIIEGFNPEKSNYYESKYFHLIDQILINCDNYNGKDKVLPQILGCNYQYIDVMMFHVDSMIYKCTALACSQEHAIGQFHPRFKLFGNKVNQYNSICAAKLRKCRNCTMKFICGGPCPARYIMRDRPINKVLCPGEAGVEDQILKHLRRNKQRICNNLASLGKPDLQI